MAGGQTDVYTPIFAFTHLLPSFHGQQLKPSFQIRNPLYWEQMSDGNQIRHCYHELAVFGRGRVCAQMKANNQFKVLVGPAS